MRLVLSLVLLAAVLAVPAFAQWGGGGCPIPTTPPTVPVWSPSPVIAPVRPTTTPTPIGDPPGPGYRWADLPNVGWGWVHSSVKTADPAPAGEPRRVGDVIPGGVDWSKIDTDGREHYSINGRPVDPRLALASAGDGGLVDDSAWPWVVVVADESTRERVSRDRETAPLAGLRVRWKLYPPGHDQVKDHKPGVTVQAPNGRPLAHLPSYENAGRLAEAVNDAVSKYDPARDPGPGKPYPDGTTPADPDKDPCDGDEKHEHTWLCVILAALFAFFTWLQKRMAA